jgi:hypothetical protein
LISKSSITRGLVPPKRFNPVHLFKVGTIDLRVVFHLAWLYQSGVEFLVGTQITDLPDNLSPRRGQSDDVNPFWLTPGN